LINIKIAHLQFSSRSFEHDEERSPPKTNQTP
jgi:hypothetical protein